MTFSGEIRIEKLLKMYGSLKAVDNLSLNVAAGEFVTLLGASGSGKTTTLMMIAGLIEADGGSISIDGKAVIDLPPEHRDLGVVFQSYALFPHLNVFDNIAFPLRMRKMGNAEVETRVKEVLNLVGLEAYSQRRISQLSGGQQQRVALARAIVFSPPVLLMDEPMGALDRQLREQLQIEIKRIQRDLGVTVLYVTHDQEEALALSDRIAIMRDGQITQVGTPDDVYIQPSSVFVASFLGESNLIPSRAVSAANDGISLSPVADTNLVFEGILSNTSNVPLAAEDLTALIRPEAIVLSDASSEALPNTVEGTIDLREFMGATIRYDVATCIGNLVVRTPRLSPNSNFGPGDRVRLSWHPTNLLVFCEQQPA